jgi:hypothetical protein
MAIGMNFGSRLDGGAKLRPRAFFHQKGPCDSDLPLIVNGDAKNAKDPGSAAFFWIGF